VKSQRLKRLDIPEKNMTSAYAIAYVNFEKEEEASLAI